ncbi:MAG: hypothetical protein HKO64_03895 [Xanthomonadales bacterium]|nr:hypothetical protein [Xanthomonadales bacterium]
MKPRFFPCIPALILAVSSAAAQDSILDTLKLPSDYQQTSALMKMLDAADEQDLQRYVEQALTIEDDRDKSGGLNLIYSRYLDLDPDAAVDHWLRESRPNTPDILVSMFYSWAKFDLEAAINKSTSLTSTRNREWAKRGILTAYAGASPAELQAIGARLGDPEESLVDGFAMFQIFQLSSADPIAALELASKVENPDQRRHVHSQIGMEWAKKDPLGALGHARNISAERDRETFKQGILGQLGNTSPTTLLDLLDEPVLGRQDRLNMVGIAFTRLSRSEPDYALTLARELTDQTLRRAAYQQIFSEAAKNDPRQALELLESLNSQELVNSHAPDILMRLAKVDAEYALAWALERPLIGQMLFNQIIAQMAGSDLEEALDVVIALPESQSRVQHLGTIVARFGSENPTEALGLLDLLPPGQIRNTTTGEIVSSWARNDPAAVTAWILEQSPQLQSSLVSNVGYAIAGTNMDLARVLVTELPPSQARTSLIGQVTHLMVQSDMNSALVWAESLPAGPDRDEALETVISNMAMRDVDHALLLVPTLGNSQRQRGAYHNILSSWMQRDIEAAAQWVLSETDGALFQQSVSQVASAWATWNLDRAVNWLSKIEHTEARDHGLASLLHHSSLTETDAGRIISAIESPQLKLQGISTYVMQVARYDIETARAMISRFATSTEQLESLNQQLEMIESRF